MPDKQDSLARRGLTLPKRVLRRLNEVGIFAQSQVSLEHQHLAKRYVVRGIESGGAVKDLGRYVPWAGWRATALSPSNRCHRSERSSRSGSSCNPCANRVISNRPNLPITHYEA